MDARSIAVVTGGNRGLGRETVRQLAERGWGVVLTARDGEQAERAAAELAASDLVVPFQLDVTSELDAARLEAFVAERFGRLDALVNNAGAIFDGGDRGSFAATPESLVQTFQTNVVGAYIVLRALRGLLVADEGASVVNVSSGMGALHDMGGGSTGYRLSKAALNALTRVAHAELSPHRVRVNSVCPGWVRTDMGGSSAPRSVADGAAGIVWAATLGPDGPSGGFFRDGRPIDW